MKEVGSLLRYVPRWIQKIILFRAVLNTHAQSFSFFAIHNLAFFLMNWSDDEGHVLSIRMHSDTSLIKMLLDFILIGYIFSIISITR